MEAAGKAGLILPRDVNTYVCIDGSHRDTCVHEWLASCMQKESTRTPQRGCRGPRADRGGGRAVIAVRRVETTPCILRFHVF